MIINWECAEIANSLARYVPLSPSSTPSSLPFTPLFPSSSLSIFGSLKPHKIIANFWLLFEIIRAGSIIAHPFSLAPTRLPLPSTRPIIWAFRCHYVNLCVPREKSFVFVCDTCSPPSAMCVTLVCVE